MKYEGQKYGYYHCIYVYAYRDSNINIIEK